MNKMVEIAYAYEVSDFGDFIWKELLKKEN